MEYTFDKAKHLHKLDGKNLTGVTTVLSILAKPALIQWSANQAVEYIEKNFPSVDQLIKGDFSFSDLFKEAKIAHRKKKEEAGSKGTDVHAIIEEMVKNAIEFHEGRILTGKNPNPQVQHFIDWAIENKVKFLESERNVYSVDWFIGGIVDLVMEIDGKIWIGDIKTSSGIYPEYFFQTSAYQKCLEEMGLYKEIVGHVIINLKKDGTFDEKRSISNEENKKAFEACLTLYRIQEKIKNNLN